MIRGVFERRSDILNGYRVVLFGSRARGGAGGRSDFDIGSIGAEPLSPQAYNCIENDLEDLPTLYRIDWVDLSRVPTQFRERALEEGLTLYEG